MPNFPSNPTSGQVFLWKGNKYVWNGRQWLNVTEYAVDTIAIATVSSSPPSNPSLGQMWFKDNTRELFVWVDTLTGGEWKAVTCDDVENSSLVVVSDSIPPGDPPIGSLWYRPFENDLFIRIDSLSGPEWELITQGTPESDPLVTVSESPPASEQIGHFWFRPSLHELSVLVDLGGGYEWVSVSPGAFEPEPPVSVSVSAPLNPQIGDLWYNPSSEILFVRIESLGSPAWEEVNQEDVEDNPPVIVSESEPSDPEPGSLWFRKSSEELFLRVPSLSGDLWETIFPSSSECCPPVTISASPPLDPAEGDLWYDTTLGNFCVWYLDLDGGQWVAVGSDGSESNFLLSDEDPSPLGEISPGVRFEASRSDHVHPLPSLGELADLDLVEAVNLSLLYYNAISGKWEAKPTVTVPEVTNGGNF